MAKHTEETKKKISESLKGRKLSEEHKRKLSKALKGIHRSEETRKKMSERQKGNKNCNWGKHLSEEHKRKISEAQKGSKSYRWKGGRVKHGKGYIYIYNPTHPFCNNMGYVSEHRLAMEKHLGRTLLPTEVVHHINGIVDDNRVENLMLFSNHIEHTKYHNNLRK